MNDIEFDFFEEDPEFIEVDTTDLNSQDDQEGPQKARNEDFRDDGYNYTLEAEKPSPAILKPSGFTLRDYQEFSVQRVYEEWDKGNGSTLLVLPTGTGKTPVAGTIVRRYPGHYGFRDDGHPRRVLFLAHRDYLLKQAANTFAALGVDSAIEKGEARARGGLFENPTCVIASVQSMQENKKTARLLEWPRDYFDLIITDEGHHGPSPTYRKIYDYFRPRHMLFITATPERLDGDSLESLCDSKAYEYLMVDAVNKGWLCQIKIRWCDTQIDLSKIRTTAGDLNQKDIEEAIAPHIEALARATKKEIGNRKTLVFTPDVGSSQAFASAMTSLGINSESLDGKVKEEQRNAILDSFRQGHYQLLSNCALFTEGFDVADVSAVVLLRPTKSLSLYRQMVGRGTRLADGKENLIVVDFPWVAGRHSLVKPMQLFKSTKADEERFKEAERQLDTGATDDLMEALTKADEVLEERRQFKVKARDGKVKYRRVEYDPIAAASEALGVPHRPENDGGVNRLASEKQIKVLTSNGIAGAEAMSSKRASIIIGKIFERRELGLSTYKQIQAMIRFGVDPKEARSSSFQEASAILDRLINRHKGNRV